MNSGNLSSPTFEGGHASGHYTVQNERFPFTWPNRLRVKQEKSPKFRTSKFLFLNRVYDLHKPVLFTEKRPRKRDTRIKDRFEQIEDEFPFGIFRAEQQGPIARTLACVQPPLSSKKSEDRGGCTQATQTPVSANPGLNVDPGFFFFLSKGLSWIFFFSILFRVSSHQVVGKEN